MVKLWEIEQLCGLDERCIDFGALSVPVHRALVTPFLALAERSRASGFDLAIVSGYRSFDRQLNIWNQKLKGERPVYDDEGVSLDLTALNDWGRVQAVLRWSALPGTSRHHWGTDIDVYDRAAVSADYQVQLSPEEVIDDGPFGPFHCWLDKQIEENNAEGFFRPYTQDLGGVAPERWHLSYAPLACDFEKKIGVESLRRILANKPLQLKQTVLDHLEEIVDRYVFIAPFE